MQKIINVLAVASFAVSGAVVVSGVYVYVNRDSILDGVKSQVMDAVQSQLGDFGGLVGGGMGTSPTGGALIPEAASGIPSGPFGGASGSASAIPF